MTQKILDLDDYINQLHRDIDHLKNLNQSLRTEIKTQRNEIAQYRHTINTLLNWDKIPEQNTEMDFNAND